MKFLSLFSARARHERYADGSCPDLEWQPSAETRQLLARYRLHLEQSADGVAVWAPARADGKAAWIPIARDELFAFQLLQRDPEFARFTDLAEFNDKTDPVYTNAGAGTADGRTLTVSDRKSWTTQTFVLAAAATPLRLTLAATPLALGADPLKTPRASDFSVSAVGGTVKVTGYDATARALTVQGSAAGLTVSLRYRTRPPASHRGLADVLLYYNKSMPGIGKDDAPYEIRFKPRAALWAYYLVTDFAGDFSIVDTDAAAPITFGAADAKLPNEAADDPDPFATTLAIQYPAQRRLRFLSDQPLPCSSVARKGIALRLGDNKVLEALPSVSVSRPSRIRLQPAGIPQDQDTFCQVIKYLKAR